MENDEKKAMFRRHLDLYETFKQKPSRIKLLENNVYGHFTFKPILNKPPKTTNHNLTNLTFQQRQDEHINKLKQQEMK